MNRPLEANVHSGLAPCLLCDGTLDVTERGIFDTRFGIDAEYLVASCRRCGGEQTSPMPTSDQLKTWYEAHYNFGGETGTRYTRLRARVLTSSVYRLWLRLDGDISFWTRKGPGRLLDIGCNEGRSLQIYRSNGFAAEGLELNEAAAAVARREGFVVHTEPLETYRPAAAFDVAVLSNVLEHSLNPRHMLLNVHRILKLRGQVWISCPNSRSWLRSIFGRYWINWHVPFHIVHFSRETLCRLLAECGFEVAEAKQETPALWVAHSIIAHWFAKRGAPTSQLRRPILVAALMLLIRGLLFPVLWYYNRNDRGDCLVAVATKHAA